MSRVTTAYLAHPIDQVHGDKPYVRKDGLDRELGMRDWIQMARRALTAYGLTQYSPGLGWSVPGGRRGEPTSTLSLAAISATNQAAMEQCDCLVAILPAGVATIGVVLEIERAVVAGKPTVLLIEEGLADKSASVRDWLQYGHVWLVPVKMEPRGEKSYSADLDEAIEWLAGQEPALAGGGRPEWVINDPYGVCLFTVGEGGKTPTRSYEGDAGFDLYCSRDMTIAPGDYVDIPTSVSVALPKGYWALVTGRSSAWRKRGLLVIDGVIDNGYRGELFSAVYNPSSKHVGVNEGERLAQMILLPTWSGRLQQVDELPASERGSNGFGSTGA